MVPWSFSMCHCASYKRAQKCLKEDAKDSAIFRCHVTAYWRLLSVGYSNLTYCIPPCGHMTTAFPGRKMCHAIRKSREHPGRGMCIPGVLNFSFDTERRPAATPAITSALLSTCITLSMSIVKVTVVAFITLDHVWNTSKNMSAATDVFCVHWGHSVPCVWIVSKSPQSTPTISGFWNRVLHFMPTQRTKGGVKRGT